MQIDSSKFQELGWILIVAYLQNNVLGQDSQYALVQVTLQVLHICLRHNALASFKCFSRIEDEGEEGRRLVRPQIGPSSTSTGSCAADLGSPDTRRRQFHCLSPLPPPPPPCQTSRLSGNKLIPRVPHLCYTSPPPPPLVFLLCILSHSSTRLDNCKSASKTTKCAICGQHKFQKKLAVRKTFWMTIGL